jgi:hypothetical protein
VNYPVIDRLSPDAFLGEIDRNWTSTNSFGGTAQVTSTDKFLGHENHFVAGMSIDRGLSQFTGSSMQERRAFAQWSSRRTALMARVQFRGQTEEGAEELSA